MKNIERLITLLLLMVVAPTLVDAQSDAEKMRLGYVLKPEYSDTMCLKDIRRAQLTIAAKGICLAQKLDSESNPWNFRVELDQLLKPYGMFSGSDSVGYKKVSPLEITEQTDGCYVDYMNLMMYMKFGGNFRDSMLLVADRMLYFADSLDRRSVDIQNGVYGSWECNTAAEVIKFDSIVGLPRFSIRLCELHIPRGAKPVGNTPEVATVSLDVIVDKKGLISDIQTIKVDLFLEENMLWKRHIIERAKAYVSQYCTWEPAKRESNKVKSRNRVTIRVLRPTKAVPSYNRPLVGYDKKRFANVLKPEVDDIECIYAIKKAKKTIQEEGICVTQVLQMSDEWIFQNELNELLKPYKMLYASEYLSCLLSPYESDHCFADYMNYKIIRKHGFYFRDSIVHKADSLYKRRVDVKNNVYGSWECDTVATVVKRIKESKLPVFSEQLHERPDFGSIGILYGDNPEIAAILVSFIVEKDGTVSDAKAKKITVWEEENARWRTRCYKRACWHVRDKYLWSPAIREGKTVRSRNEVLVHFLR